MLNLVYFWLIMGTVWASYAIIDYYHWNSKDKMNLFSEVVSIFLNVIFFPIEIIVGFFIYFMIFKADNTVSFNFMITKLHK